MAGVAFAENEAYEEESKWIYRRINMNDGPGVSWPIIGALYDRMGELWGKQRFTWGKEGFGVLELGNGFQGYTDGAIE